MPYLTGDTGGLDECRQFLLPQDFYVRLAIRGAITELVDPALWEKFGTLEPEECAEIIRLHLNTWGECGVTPGFGSGPISDDFNRADEYPLANWYHFYNGIQLLRGAARGMFNGYNIAWYNATDYGPDVEVHARMCDADMSTSGVVVYARLTNYDSPALNGYLAGAIQNSGSDYIMLQRMDAAIPTSLHTPIAQAVYPGHRIGMRLVGDQISLFYDAGAGWVERITVTDATYATAGRTGILLIDYESACDDFTVTEI